MKKEKNNIVKTDDLVFEYIRRDEDGNVEGITTGESMHGERGSSLPQITHLH